MLVGWIVATLLGLTAFVVLIAALNRPSPTDRPDSPAARETPEQPRQPSPPQPGRPPRESETAAGEKPLRILGWSLSFGFLMLIRVAPLVYLLVDILILVWVVKDARARNTDGAIWALIILVSGILGLIVYVASRPQGVLIGCPRCGNKRLMASHRCPHCGRMQRHSS
jgi:hypothetical protein